MAQNILSEETIHYIAAFLERYAEKYPTQNHTISLAEIRRVSDALLESLGKPLEINVRRHKK